MSGIQLSGWVMVLLVGNLFATNGWADQVQENIVENGSFEQGREINVPGWVFYAGKNLQGTLEKGISDDAVEGKQSLSIVLREGQTHVWWSQRLPAHSQKDYQISLSAKADVNPGADYHLGATCCFKDGDGKWIGAKKIIEVGQDQKDWPDYRKAASKQWTRFNGRFTTPPNTAEIELRLGLGARDGSTLTVLYDDVKLTTSGSEPEDSLGDSPRQIQPDMQMPVLPLQASWEIKKAQRVQSATRDRICINGLWRFQPEFHYGQAPDTRQWGYLRVPGIWIDAWGRFNFVFHQAEKTNWYSAMMDYRRTGMKSERWKDKDLSRFSIAWYERLVDIPAGWQGRIISINATVLDRAAMFYLNGKPVGKVEAPGGQIVLPNELIQFGKLNALTARVIGSGYVGRNQYHLRSGWGSGLSGDVFLEATPVDVNIADVFVIPDTQDRNLTVKANVDSDKIVNGIIRVRIQNSAGSLVKQFDSQRMNLKQGIQEVTVVVPWLAKNLWCPDSPDLYDLNLSFVQQDGRIADQTLPIVFGFRDFKIKEKQFLLNGKPYRLRPYLHIPSAYACEQSDDAIVQSLVFHKTMGFNALEYRGSQQIIGESIGYYDTLLREADRLGMLVLWQLENLHSKDQYKGFDNSKVWEKYRQQALSEPIQRLRNHPSIAMWSPSMNFNGNRDEAAPWLLGQMPDLNERNPQATKAMNRVLEEISNLDPSRPVFFHDANNLGPVANYNYHFNFPPLQEREEYPSKWSQDGVKPLMMVEAADCYTGNFQKKRAGGSYLNGEPLGTEYFATYFGGDAYTLETDEYAKMVMMAQRQNGQWDTSTSLGAIAGLPAYRRLACLFTINTRRAWRTWGVSGGLLPWYCINGEAGYGGKPMGGVKPMDLPVDLSDNLQSPGLRVDRWDVPFKGSVGFSYNYTYPDPEMPKTCPAPPFSQANDIYRAMRQVNMPLMVYIAGNEKRFTAKDHGYYAGQQVDRQIVAVWDGVGKRSLTIKWRVLTEDDHLVALGQSDIQLEQGQILHIPFTFTVPNVNALQHARIELTTSENGKQIDESWCRDRFNLEFYPLPEKINTNSHVAVIDPKGYTTSWLKQSGLEFETLAVGHEETALGMQQKFKAVDVLIVGREGLSIGLLEACAPAIRNGMTLLVFEQQADILQSLGFRTIDVAPRYCFATRNDSSLVEGLPAEGLRNWQGSSTLLDPYPQTLKPKLDYRWGNYGAVASVLIEKPHMGAFTPVLEAEFDLRFSPLMWWQMGNGRVLFCQMDITDRYGLEPAATKLADNILRNVTEGKPSVMFRSAVGLDALSTTLMDQLGFSSRMLKENDDFSGLDSRTLLVISPETKIQSLVRNQRKLADFTQRGGQVLCLFLDQQQIQSGFLPFVPKVSQREFSKTRLPDLSPGSSLLQGISISDLHYRSSQKVCLFDSVPQGSFKDEAGVLAAVGHGKGRYIFWQLDPSILSKERSYANLWNKQVHAGFNRYSLWHVNRVLSQLLTNCGIRQNDQSIETMLAGSWKFKLAGEWQTHASDDKQLEMEREQYTVIEHDTSTWLTLVAPGSWPVNPETSSPVFDNRTDAHNSDYSIWYRKTFMVPDSLLGRPLLLNLGVIDDADETYVNGVKVGGISRDNSKTFWKDDRCYVVPAAIIRYGQPNVISFRMTDYQGGWGGFLRGPTMQLSEYKKNEILYCEPLELDDNPYRVYWW